MKEITNQKTTIPDNYHIDDEYFKDLMVDLGMYIAQKYEKDELVSPIELMSQIAYISDLTVTQKMYFGFWLGLHYEDQSYEEFILKCMNTFK